MDYKSFEIRVKEESFLEILHAELAEAGFDSFDSTDQTLRAFAPLDAFDPETASAILEAYKPQIEQVSQHDVPHQNWNAVWESNYEPLIIGDQLFIGAPFHEAPEHVAHVIVLEPNMSFGTGHHPTTFMILESMSAFDFKGRSFLDFGCGSAVLSIYANQLGARGLGIEIDDHAANAAAQNVSRNQCDDVTIVCGDIQSIPSESYDFIFANINRNVIEESLSQLVDALAADGHIFFSGFLRSDATGLQSLMERRGLCIKKVEHKNEWSMILANKNS